MLVKKKINPHWYLKQALMKRLQDKLRDKMDRWHTTTLGNGVTVIIEPDPLYDSEYYVSKKES